jgi:hypothetical protein
MTDFIVDYWWMLLLVAVVGSGIFLLYRDNPLFRGKPDIKWEKLDADLKWDDDAATADSLGRIYEYVLGYSLNTIEWYQTRRRAKRRWGLSLRTGALLLTAGAGAVPLSDKLGIGPIEAVWSTLMLAAAGVLVSVDLLQGHTSGWVRYMLAQQKVERLRDEFLMDWNGLKAAKTDTKAMLERARTLLLAVGKVVDQETQEWATEFLNALKEMEKARKEAAEIERSGAVEVSVENPHVVAEWILEIDGGERGRTSGKTLAVTDVRVGIRKLKAYGEDANGNRFCAESAVNVRGGATVGKELELS